MHGWTNDSAERVIRAEQTPTVRSNNSNNENNYSLGIFSFSRFARNTWSCWSRRNIENGMLSQAQNEGRDD